MRSVIAGTGSHIPTHVVPNEHFLHHAFHGPDRKAIDKSNAEILQQFEAITTIRGRRGGEKDQSPSALGFLAAQEAIESSGVDPESLDYIVFGHNFGDVRPRSHRSDMAPALAARGTEALELST